MFVTGVQTCALPISLFITPPPTPSHTHTHTHTEKPSLQSRHSLDSVRTQEKDSGPLWITLALQKQKGFREQQQGRDDRRSQREAKLAEKQAKETVRDSNARPACVLSRDSQLYPAAALCS